MVCDPYVVYGACSHTPSHTLTHAYTLTPSRICIHPHMHTLTCTHPHMHIPSHAHALTCTHPHIPAHTLTCTPSHAHTLTCTYPHMSTPSHTLTCTHPHAHTLTCPQAWILLLSSVTSISDRNICCHFLS